MPQSQAARRSHYQFGAKSAGATDDEAEVLRFQRKFNHGGSLDMLFEAPDSAKDISVTVQVSEDGTIWLDTTAAENETAVVDEVVKPKTTRLFRVHMRAKLDEFVRILARGNDRGGVTITGNEIQELKNVANFKGGGSGE